MAYALSGGLAVSIYAAPRATQDIDLLVGRDDLDRAVSALGSIGFQPAGRPMRVAGGRLGADILPLDLLFPGDAGLALKRLGGSAHRGL